jgi:HEAT repeat protein
MGQRRRLLALLSHGDRRSIGRADEVAFTVLRRPGYLPELAAGLWHPEPLVRMRAGDALEKVSRQRPDWLRPIGQDLLDLAARTEEQELQWHLAQLLPRVGLSVRQRKALVPVLRRYLQVPSVIVRVSALQALVELMGTDSKLRPLVRRQLLRALMEGSPAERARARKLLAAGAA